MFPKVKEEKLNSLYEMFPLYGSRANIYICLSEVQTTNCVISVIQHTREMLLHLKTGITQLKDE